jgi:hypothetical protein
MSFRAPSHSGVNVLPYYTHQHLQGQIKAALFGAIEPELDQAEPSARLKDQIFNMTAEYRSRIATVDQLCYSA